MALFNRHGFARHIEQSRNYKRIFMVLRKGFKRQLPFQRITSRYPLIDMDSASSQSGASTNAPDAMITPIVQIIADNEGARAAALAELDKLVDDMPYNAAPNFAREGWMRSSEGTPIYVIRVPAQPDGEGNTGGRKTIRATGTRGRHLPPRVSDLTEADLTAQRAARDPRHARRSLAIPATPTSRKRKAVDNLDREGNASETGSKRTNTTSQDWVVTHTTTEVTKRSPWSEFNSPSPRMLSPSPEMLFLSPEHIERERMSEQPQTGPHFTIYEQFERGQMNEQPQIELLPPRVLDEDSKEAVKAAAEELAKESMMLD
ncbi:MAG: hypothetical protein Q9203_007012 [Teloschistes exilis]